jgi:hypothetical protein
MASQRRIGPRGGLDGGGCSASLGYTAAAHEIERRLLRAPEKAGESRKPGTRVMILTPLTIAFHVNARLNAVLISSVRVKKRREGDA